MGKSAMFGLHHAAMLPSIRCQPSSSTIIPVGTDPSKLDLNVCGLLSAVLRCPRRRGVANYTRIYPMHRNWVQRTVSAIGTSYDVTCDASGMLSPRVYQGREPHCWICWSRTSLTAMTDPSLVQQRTTRVSHFLMSRSSCRHQTELLSLRRMISRIGGMLALE